MSRTNPKEPLGIRVERTKGKYTLSIALVTSLLTFGGILLSPIVNHAYPSSSASTTAPCKSNDLLDKNQAMLVAKQALLDAYVRQVTEIKLSSALTKENKQKKLLDLQTEYLRWIDNLRSELKSIDSLTDIPKQASLLPASDSLRLFGSKSAELAVPNQQTAIGYAYPYGIGDSLTDIPKQASLLPASDSLRLLINSLNTTSKANLIVLILLLTTLYFTIKNYIETVYFIKY